MTDAAGALPSTAADNTACPRCGGGFHCGVEDGVCACFGLKLSELLKARLAEQYPGQCLCMRCLASLAAEPDAPARQI